MNDKMMRHIFMVSFDVHEPKQAFENEKLRVTFSNRKFSLTNNDIINEKC